MVVTRRNILNDSNVRDKYIEGVKLLKQDFLRQDWTNTYDIFVIWHYYAMMTATPPGSDRNAAHRGPSFLPWHRWFLILLEHHLQRVLDDPDFGLPYWDWASDGELPPNQQPMAPIWADDCMGGSGSPVTTGPFRDGQWKVNIESIGFPDPILVRTNRPLRRALGREAIASNLPTKEDVRRAVIRGQPNVVYDAAPWNTNSVFFLNHCNVDRIWEDWQQRHGNPPYFPNNSAGTALRGHRLNDGLFAVTRSNLFDPIYRGRVRPADLLDVSARYVYDAF